MAARKIPKKLDQDGLWEYALRVLGQRAHSASQLKQKLSRRAQSASDVAAVIARTKEYGLSDDKRFSEAFASSRLQNQGFGRFRVLRELRSKRVAPSVAEKVVEQIYSETDETQLIDNFLRRKFRGKNLSDFLKDEKNLAAAYRRLRTAGFSSSRSFTVLKRYTTIAEEWEQPPEE